MKYDSQIMGLLYEDCPKIVTVGVIDCQGRLLRGKRRDNGKWTNPGGHVDPGEDITDAAIRELHEEAGIEARTVQLVRAQKYISHRTGKPFVVFAFIAKVFSEKATNKNDPDSEFSEMRWVPMFKGAEELTNENSHAKEDMILQYLHLV